MRSCGCVVSRLMFNLMNYRSGAYCSALRSRREHELLKLRTATINDELAQDEADSANGVRTGDSARSRLWNSTYQGDSGRPPNFRIKFPEG